MVRVPASHARAGFQTRMAVSCQRRGAPGRGDRRASLARRIARYLHQGVRRRRPIRPGSLGHQTRRGRGRLCVARRIPGAILSPLACGFIKRLVRRRCLPRWLARAGRGCPIPSGQSISRARRRDRWPCLRARRPGRCWNSSRFRDPDYRLYSQISSGDGDAQAGAFDRRGTLSSRSP
jgi:hypothetical protein